MRITHIKCPPDGGLPGFQLEAEDYRLEDLRWLRRAYRLGKAVQYVEPPAPTKPLTADQRTMVRQAIRGA